MINTGLNNQPGQWTGQGVQGGQIQNGQPSHSVCPTCNRCPTCGNYRQAPSWTWTSPNVTWGGGSGTLGSSGAVGTAGSDYKQPFIK